MGIKRLSLGSARRPYLTVREVLDLTNSHEETSDGYFVRCPAHPDGRPSLHVTPDTRDPRNAILWCFAGCSYASILEALESRRSSPEPREEQGLSQPPRPSSAPSAPLSVLKTSQSPLDRWAEYTRVPREFWEQLGVGEIAAKREIVFSWPGLRSVKFRNPWQKGLRWENAIKGFTPLWPEPSDEIGDVVICEGEHDVGIARYHLNLEAYTIGSSTSEFTPEDIALLGRANSITFIGHADKAGRAGVRKLMVQLRDHEIPSSYLDISPLCIRKSRWEAETDLGDLFERLGTDLYAQLSALEPRPLHLPGRRLDNVMADPDVEPDWLWKPFLARGYLTLFAAMMKSGKTTLWRELVRSMIQQIEFLGRNVQTTKVLILTENRAPVFRKRMARLLGVPTENVHVMFRWEQDLADLDWKEIVPQVRIATKELGIGLLIVDTVSAWMGIYDENSPNDVRQAMSPLVRLIDQLPTLAVMLIHHTTKTGEDFRGSGAFQADADILMHMTGRFDDPRQLKVWGLEDVDQITFVRDEDTLVLATGGSTITKRHREVFDVMTDVPMGYAEIQTASGLSYDAVKMRIDEMLEIDLIRKVKVDGERKAMFRKRPDAGWMQVTFRTGEVDAG